MSTPNVGGTNVPKYNPISEQKNVEEAQTDEILNDEGGQSFAVVEEKRTKDSPFEVFSKKEAASLEEGRRRDFPRNEPRLGPPDPIPEGPMKEWLRVNRPNEFKELEDTLQKLKGISEAMKKYENMRPEERMRYSEEINSLQMQRQIANGNAHSINDALTRAYDNRITP